MGSATSITRTAELTEIALFVEGNLTAAGGTTTDPGWTSLLSAPPFPDYVSAPAVVMGGQHCAECARGHKQL